MATLSTSVLRVLIVDDHELTRYALKLAFSRQPWIELVGLASNGKEAIDLVQECQPDLVILDLHMPEMNGWEASKQIKSQYPHIKIIAYSAAEGGKAQAIEGGAIIDAFCDKEARTSKLLETIKSLA